MMELICESRLCTGCAACSQICPKGAVVMTADPEGFYYPRVDGKLCNDCGLCAGTCPVNTAVKNRSGSEDDGTSGDQSYKAYACFSKNSDIRAQSTSGGIFTELARKTLSENGVVFGAGFDENFHVHHQFIENEKELDRLRGSKYVQSDTSSAFREVKSFLAKGRPVLFCGTPCQIAGLKAFLNRKYEKLLTCELACHGVPSPKVWEMFLDFISKKYGSKVKVVSFRDKSTGWNSSSMKIVFENGSKYMDSVKRETYFIGFGKSIFNRRSCFNCNFRIRNTKADITIADFWGIDRNGEPEFTDNRGVSLVIPHTPAGEQALSRISGEICIKPRQFSEAVKYNPRLISSVPEPDRRKAFFDDMRAEYDFDKLRKKYMYNSGIKYRVKILIKRLLGR